MSKIRQKQVFDGHTGVTHYEITFTALAYDWIAAETYEEISDMIDVKISAPESFQAQSVYDALIDMMAMWRTHRHTESEDWRRGMRCAWVAAGGDANDLK
jgi:hypothetical protein